jgi:hypothetical protein
MANEQEFGSGTAVADPIKAVVGAAEKMLTDAAARVGKKAGEIASSLGHKADDATTAVGKGVHSLAGSMREGGPHEGVLGSANSTIADTLETSGKHLQEQGLSGLAEDIAQTIRRHPLPAVFIGVGVGYLLARVIRS